MKKSNIKAGRNISKTATAEASKSCMPDEFQGMARCASGERTERSQTYVSTPSPDAQQRQPLKAEGNKSFKFPVDWSPYPFQLPLWRYLYSGGKKAIAIWHRRAGKDIMGINWITASAIREVGIYWYVYPTYNQAKMSVWDGMTLSGRPYMSFIPKGVIARSQQYKQRILFKMAQ